MTTTNIPGWNWLAADYHFPVTYSLRAPMTSTSSASAMPAPGPATVRLALVRTGIEMFGIDYTRDELFPVIRQAEIRIRPPEKIAISNQFIRAYKATYDESRMDVRLDESPIYREVAQAAGVMTVFINVPTHCEEDFRTTLAAIGYWGQADSLACCTEICHAMPDDQCAVALRSIIPTCPAKQFLASVASEFRDAQVDWKEVMPLLHSPKQGVVKMEIYVWPMVICERHTGGKTLLRCSLK